MKNKIVFHGGSFFEDETAASLLKHDTPIARPQPTVCEGCDRERKINGNNLCADCQRMSTASQPKRTPSLRMPDGTILK